jgi:GTP-binding protein HflX
MSRAAETTRAPRERILVCGVLLPEIPPEHGGALNEAVGLVEAAGAEPVGPRLVQRRPRPHPATLMGKGKVDEVRDEVRSLKPDGVLVDNDLTPAQVRNLEKAWGVRVIDRSEVIMDIFAARAQTHQARLQVELAQMEYLRPRLRRMWTHLERIEGGIGTRGPGETQLETDRRLLNNRIRDLKARLAEIERRKRRQVSSRNDVFTVGLVGYTNAGKSTLLNRLTGAEEFAADMPFATLDTRTRKWRLPEGRTVLLSDTVGFLQRLPHHLVASFHATLEEALSVDLLLHVVDASHPDAATQMEAVEEVLRGITARPADVYVLNKVDEVEDPIRLQLLVTDPHVDVVHVSARTGEGLERLVATVARRLDARSAVVDVHLPPSEGRLQALVRSSGFVLSQAVDEDGHVVLRARLSERALGALRHEASDAVRVEVVEPVREPSGRRER